MDIGTLTQQFGPYGGIIAVLALFAQKWLAHKKTTYRLKKVREIIEGVETDKNKVEQISTRFKYWAWDDEG